MDLGIARSFGQKPSYLLSYEPFWGNDQHVVNYFGDVPYYVLDKGERHPHRVDVVSSTCPCAGLSTLSAGYGDDNQNNRWMGQVARYVLGEMKPEVYFGENAPGLAGKIGKNVRAELIEISREHGYSMSLYRTKSLLHGIPQVRDRAFYFFWKGERVPLLRYFNRPYEKIEDVITAASRVNSLQEPINKKTPSEDPYYRYLLEVVHDGISHREYFDKIDATELAVRSYDVMSSIEKTGRDYRDVSKWMGEHGYDRAAARCLRVREKLESGRNVMRRGVIVPKEYIGAFVGHYPTSLTHPREDRFITYREALSIMGMPSDFELIDYEKNANHICQNVPVGTAADIASEVLEALNGRRDTVDSDLVFQYNASKTEKIASRSRSTLDNFLA